MRLLSVPSFVRVPKHGGVRCSRSIIWAFNGNKRIHPRGRTISHSAAGGEESSAAAIFRDKKYAAAPRLHEESRTGIILT